MTRVIPLRWLPRVNGITLTPGLILVKAARAGDKALIAHEMQHAEQMREFGTLVFWWRYLSDPEFRLEMELEGYRVQLVHQPWNLDAFAQALSTRYFLNLTPTQAKYLLCNPAR